MVLRRPDDELHEECNRLQTDNRRLVALLGRTTEFKRLVHETAELRGTHYVPLSVRGGTTTTPLFLT